MTDLVRPITQSVGKDRRGWREGTGDDNASGQRRGTTVAAELEQWRVAVGEGVRVIAPNGSDATPRAKKARALVAYLAAMPGRAAARSTLISLLWSDRASEQARASLRQCLFELRSGSPGLIDTDGETVTLNAVVAVSGSGPLSPLDRIDPAFDHWLTSRRVDAKAGVEGSAIRPVMRRGLVLALAGLALTGALGAWLALRPAAPHPPVLLLTPLAGAADPLTRAAATRFAETAQAMLASSRVRLLPGDQPRQADWVAGGSIDGDTAGVRVTAPQGALLWSAREDVGRDGGVAAADRLGHRAARMMSCAAGGPPTRRDAATTARLMNFCDFMLSSVGSKNLETTVALARQLVAAAPHDAYAHGHLAASLAFGSSELPPSLAAPARAEAEREAANALALDARTGEGWLARVILARDRRDFAGTEAAIRNGLAAEPDHPHLPNYLANLLTSVGRLDEALVEAQRALALDPASPAKRATVASLLLRTRSPRAAFALLSEPGIYDPAHVLAHQRVTLLLWNGDTTAVRAVLAAAGDTYEPSFAADWTARTRAIDDPHGPDAAALLRQIAAIRNEPDRSDYRLIVLAALGHTDAALDEALRSPVQTEIFFRPDTRALLLSRRFPQVARFQGLWAYWSTTDHWPDICTDPALGWHCPVKSPSMPR